VDPITKEVSFLPLFQLKSVIRVLDSFSHVPREKVRLSEFKNKKAYLVPRRVGILEIITSYGKDTLKFRGDSQQLENWDQNVPSTAEVL